MTVNKEDSQEDSKKGQSEVTVPSGEDENDVRVFPDPFYDLITKKLLDDPVVIPDGNSYERSAIQERGDISKEKRYSNRALKQIIDEALETSGDSLQAGMKRMGRSMRKSIRQLLEKSVLPIEEYRDLPDSYYCAITFGLMHDPVIDPDGNTFERTAIANWIKVNGTSPITRTSVSVKDLYPNKAITDLLEGEKSKGEDAMHPSIRKWKDESPPQIPGDVKTGGEAGTHAASNNNMPTTYAELDERQRKKRRAQIACNAVGIFLLVGLICLSIVYGGYFLLALLFGYVCFGALL